MIASDTYAMSGGSITATDPDRSAGSTAEPSQPLHYFLDEHIFFDEYYADYYAYNRSSYEPENLPAHRHRNPFEHEIHFAIECKHSVYNPNQNRNITFKRANMRGFF